MSTDTGERYQKRTEPVYSGECSVCGSIIRPKTTTNGKQEWFCHLCGGARHFCEHPECFMLHEVFYSKCEGDSHRRLLVIWEEISADPEDDDGWLAEDTQLVWRLDPNGPVYR